MGSPPIYAIITSVSTKESDMNRSTKPRSTSKPAGKSKSARRKSVREINTWMRANYDNLLEKAKRNCIALTGKPTFGGVRTRKSA
jgi:hypothetical protein